jgi:hypothetical protein
MIRDVSGHTFELGLRRSKRQPRAEGATAFSAGALSRHECTPGTVASGAPTHDLLKSRGKGWLLDGRNSNLTMPSGLNDQSAPLGQPGRGSDGPRPTSDAARRVDAQQASSPSAEKATRVAALGGGQTRGSKLSRNLRCAAPALLYAV